MTDTVAPQKKGWFQRLTAGLSRSSRTLGDSIANVVVARRTLDQAALDELEEMLIEADLGPEAAGRVVASFAENRFGRSVEETEIKVALADAVARELIPRQGRFDPLTGAKPFVVLFIGVNGSGKTTTLGKIAHDLHGRGARVLIAAGDTFRAAATEQLKVWADRTGADFIAKHQGADAAALAYEAFERARREGHDVLLIDTAGRLENKAQLMDELIKMVRVLKRLDPDAPHETLLVLDATAGRNAVAQERTFGRMAQVSGVVMTKLDGTARGGVLVPIAQNSDAPIVLVGVGEGLDDLQPFDARAFSRTLVGLGEA
jgi:fused signal recognition particle receptor